MDMQKEQKEVDELCAELSAHYDPQKPKTVLVVDDNDLVREITSDILKIEGYSPIEKRESREAIKTLQENSVDLIITDYNMPEMNGIEFTRRIRETSNIPIIISTGTPHYFVEAREAGANYLLKKPFEVSQLIDVVKEALGE